MGDSAGATFPSEGAGAQDPKMDKGKEKATEPTQEEDVSMGEDEDDDDSSEESEGDEVRQLSSHVVGCCDALHCGCAVAID